MCRFVAYIGTPILVDELLIKPENSLVNQSYDAEEMSQPLNGDGFGLGWYNRQIRAYPGLFRSITPAWNNQNLLYNASLIKTDCLFAHIRAASEGVVAEQNCHPFHFEDFLMMHNGGIPDFGKIKRQLIDQLEEDIFLWISGQTDTEHIFALLMQVVRNLRKETGRPLNDEDLAACFQETFDRIEALKKARGIQELSAYNMMVTNGRRIIGTRYSTDPENVTPTLYYASGARYECRNGESRMITNGHPGEKAVLIVSEKLTRREEDWHPIPPNHFISVDEKLSVRLIPMEPRLF